MWSSVCVCLLLLLASGTSVAFVPVQHRGVPVSPRVVRSRSSVGMSTTEDPPTPTPTYSKTPATPPPSPPKETAIVPVSKENIETTSSIIGAALGFVIYGPIGAAVLAAVSNYVSKKEGDLGDATRGLATTVLQAYNFVAKVNTKYDVTGTLTEATTSLYNSVKKDSEVLDQAESTIKSTVAKAVDLDKDYDLVAKTKTVLWQAGNISNEALKKVEELSDEYNLVEKAKEAAATAAEKVKQKLNEQTN